MAIRGDYYARDKTGDRLCSVWSEEPILDHGEWVPARHTRGEQVFLPCSPSYAAKHVGRPLRPGELVFVSLALPLPGEATPARMPLQVVQAHH